VVLQSLATMGKLGGGRGWEGHTCYFGQNKRRKKGKRRVHASRGGKGKSCKKLPGVKIRVGFERKLVWISGEKTEGEKI